MTLYIGAKVVTLVQATKELQEHAGEDLIQAIIKRYVEPGNPAYMGGECGSFSDNLRADLKVLVGAAVRAGFRSGLKQASARMETLVLTLAEEAEL